MLLAASLVKDPDFGLAQKALEGNPSADGDGHRGISGAVAQAMEQEMGQPKYNSKCGN